MTTTSPFRGVGLNTFAERVGNGDPDALLEGAAPEPVFEDDPLLPTPQAMEGAKGNNLSVADRAATGQVMLSNYAVEITNGGPAALLPTPIVDDAKNTGHNQNRRGTLASEVWLLPTPNTMEHREIKTPEQIAALRAKSPGGYRNLREEVVNEATNWGKFRPAIARWEAVLGRPAPAPTLPDGKDGAHRLSMYFAEWLMGVPEGWITDAGLSRVQALKAAGNGVVPQQAELALRILLDGMFPVVTTDTASTTVTKSLSTNVQINHTINE